MSNETTKSPGVFRGNTRLASEQDLLALREELIRLVQGNPNIHELGENGYIPWMYNEDGSLDINRLFPDLVSLFNKKSGLSIYKDGVFYKDNIKSINLGGKYVKLDMNGEGNLVLNIDEPSASVSRFNEANSISNALVKIETDIHDNMIIPNDPVEFPFYGDWTPGETHLGINWNGNPFHHFFTMTTNGPVFASSLETYFTVLVLDAYDNQCTYFKSIKITGNTKLNEKLRGDGLNNSSFVYISITNFKEENLGFSFIPIIKIDLMNVFKESGKRFRIKVIHHDDINQSSFISNDMLYNIGSKPIITNVTSYVDNDDTLPLEKKPKFQWCSGIKYITNGQVVIRLGKVYNLNNLAAVKDKISCKFESLDSNEITVADENYTLDLNDESAWKITLPIKKNVVNNESMNGFVYADNAFGQSDPYETQLSILLNTIENPKKSTNLAEYFSDESFRKYCDFSPIDESWDSTRNIMEYDKGNGLMVVPNEGVKYPFGDWTKFVPYVSPDYSNPSFLINEKYYSRVFEGNKKLKYGGVFVFEGLNIEQFFDDRLSFVFSYDNGTNWFTIKNIRNSTVSLNRNGGVMIATGVMTDIKEKNNKLYVYWSYPKTIASASKIWFKLGMKPSDFCIKSIQLLNIDETEDW